jgi:hypothetical protein
MMWPELLRDYCKRARLEINIRAIHGVGGTGMFLGMADVVMLAIGVISGCPGRTPRGKSQCLR